MADDSLAALERLYEAATPGPVRVNRYDDHGGSIVYQVQSEAADEMPTRTNTSGRVLCHFGDGYNPNARRDAELDAALRNAFPAIVKALSVAEQMANLVEESYHLSLKPDVNAMGLVKALRRALAKIGEST